MWGAEHLHGDEDFDLLLASEDTEHCVGCFAEYPECMIGEDDGLLQVNIISFTPFIQRRSIGHHCPTCRLNMTCARCSEYCESVDRAQGKSVCDLCRGTE